jgi:uncharacterized protein YbbC (DUF1343 family)
MATGRFQKSRSMSPRSLVQLSLGAVVTGAFTLMLGCVGCSTKPPEKTPPPQRTVGSPAPVPPPEKLPRVMLGIDVLEAEGFKAIAGKKIGLLTHPAGVNRRGESTLNVLRRAPQAKLVTLFAPEHGFDGQFVASANFGDTRHAATGLTIYSVHGATRKPTPAMLKGLDALVIDLQDIGSRSYTFTSAMLCAMAACFEQGVEVIVLDRPNPLGGLKVDGPPLDAEWKSYVGAFRVPYVHGLTIGELARMAKESPGVMVIPKVINVSEAVRAKGRLTVIPMRGWTRNLRWPDTELPWIPTSPMVPTFDAAVGYAMVGLGCEQSNWSSGIGKDFPFRGIGYPKKTPDEIIAAMSAYKIPGLAFVKREGRKPEGKLAPGVYVEVTDWEKWNPTELSFYMHKQAAKWERLNPFLGLTAAEQRTFKIHVGSSAWLAELQRAGSRIDVPLFLKNWAARAEIYQTQAKKFWLYPWGDTPAARK